MWRNIVTNKGGSTAVESRPVYPGTDIFKALGDETRLRAYLALCKGELCVCQLVEFLQLAPSTVSKHLSILKGAELIKSRKNGRWVYYSQSEQVLAPEFDQHLAAMVEAILGTRVVRDDHKRLREVLKSDPEVLCQIQRN
ncbi:metalloregulator ArsR/SmtB family transcription factor [candidate division GN15 bacterium]|nr:metalloregulator ArsR/SmtB family transcription factor [candidate division GN15 bacterium]